MFVALSISVGYAWAMLRNIDIALLRTLVSVAEHGSMTSAAAALNVTQAAVSLQIKRLETLLELPLFHRDKRRLLLTPDGERMLSRARQIVGLNDDLYALMTQPQCEGHLHIGVPNDIVAHFMPPVLKSFHRAYPRIDVGLRSGNSFDLMDALALGELDMTLTTEFERCASHGPLMADQLVWLGARDGTAHQQPVIPIAFTGHSCAFREPALTALDDIGRDWRVTYEVTDTVTLHALVAADYAVIPALSRTRPATLVERGSECGLPPLPPVFINLRERNGVRSDIAQAFRDHLVDAFAQWPGTVGTPSLPVAAE